MLPVERTGEHGYAPQEGPFPKPLLGSNSFDLPCSPLTGMATGAGLSLLHYLVDWLLLVDD